MRIVFAGSPDFAVPCLRALAASRHQVPLVITQPDRPAGRRRRLAPPAVKAAAQALGLRILQPDSINCAECGDAISAEEPDAVVVAAFGQKLCRRLLRTPRFGCVNLHASLLPKLRGAAPIARAIINGDTETGVTTQRMATSMDAGDILLQQATPIGEDETAGDLFQRLACLGAELTVCTIDRLQQGTVTPRPQDHSRATYAPSLTKADGAIDWSLPPQRLRNFVRGMTPWPSGFTFRHAEGRRCERLTILRVEVDEDGDEAWGEPGTVLVVKPGELVVCAGLGTVRIVRLQPAGGRPMDVAEFLRGHALREGECLHGSA